MSSVAPRFSRFDELPRLGRVNLLLLAAATAGVCVRLWPEWRHNPDLSHGFFMPVVFLLLLQESRRGTPRFSPRGIAAKSALAFLLLGGLAALGAAGVYAAAVDWSHPLVNAALTAALVLFLGAGLMVFSSPGLRFVGWNWNASVAICLWLLCAPIPPGTYTRLTLALQLFVSESVLRMLHLLGIAAIRHGNIIELAHTTVGVEDACSGVRSLLSCVFAGLFFSATLVRRRWARVLVIVIAAPLALLMNFIRSLTLTLLSNNGVDIAGKWHDLTGFAILALTAAVLAGLALLLERKGPSAAPAPAVDDVPRTRVPSGSLAALAATLAVACALAFVCVTNTHASVRRDGPVPDLAALLPAEAPGWVVNTTADLYQFTDTLRTDHLAQRIYRKREANGEITEVTLYVAYWQPGQAPVSLVMSHTPDACWPGSGWSPEPTAAVPWTGVDGRKLPAPEYRLFQYGDFPQYVWFWHLYDGAPISYRDPYSALALLKLAWTYGFRHDGDQLFVRVSSNRPWSDLAREPLLTEFFQRTQALGL